MYQNIVFIVRKSQISRKILPKEMFLFLTASDIAIIIINIKNSKNPYGKNSDRFC